MYEVWQELSTNWTRNSRWSKDGARWEPGPRMGAVIVLPNARYSVDFLNLPLCRKQQATRRKSPTDTSRASERLGTRLIFKLLVWSLLKSSHWSCKSPFFPQTHSYTCPMVTDSRLCWVTRFSSTVIPSSCPLPQLGVNSVNSTLVRCPSLHLHYLVPSLSAQIYSLDDIAKLMVSIFYTSSQTGHNA